MDFKFGSLLLFLVWLNVVQAQSPGSQLSYLTKTDIPYRDGGEIPLTDYMKERCVLDFFYPKDAKDYPTVVWFHGGGLKAGQKYIPEVLKDQGLAVAAVNYRLHPRVNCPDYIDDAAAAVAWVFKNVESFGGNPDLIFVSGHSAGGYLASMIGLDKHYLQQYDVDADRIAGLLPFSGHAITHFTVRAERGIPGTEVVVDEYAPLRHIRKDAPPYVIITGDREMELLGRYEENAYLYRMMKLVGHEQTTLLELDGFNHGEMDDPAYYLILKHIRKLLKSSEGN